MRANKFFEKIDYSIALINKIEYFPLPKSQNSTFTYYFPDDGTDIGSFINMQVKKLHNGLLTEDETIKLNTLLGMKKNCRDIKFNIKINEIADMVSPIGYIPVHLKLSNGQSVSAFIRYYKKKMMNGELSLPDMKTLRYFLDYYNTFNVKLREIDIAAKEIGRLPVIDKVGATPNYVRKFSDGTDMGSYIEKIRIKLKNNKLSLDEKNKVLALFEKYDYNKLKLTELYDICNTIGFIPVIDKKNCNKNKVRKFSDGTDVGSFVFGILNKINNGELSDEDAKYFLEIYNKYRKLTFREKVKETISLAIDIGYIPYSNKRNRRNCKFSDGTYVGVFIDNNRHDFINKKLSDEKFVLFRKLMYFDFSEYEDWIRCYQGLKEYIKIHKSLECALSNNEFSDFIYNQQERYYDQDTKDIVQEVLEDKLFELDSNWINYGRRSKNQKVKS